MPDVDVIKIKVGIKNPHRRTGYCLKLNYVQSLEIKFSFIFTPSTESQSFQCKRGQSGKVSIAHMASHFTHYSLNGIY